MAVPPTTESSCKNNEFQRINCATATFVLLIRCTAVQVAQSSKMLSVWWRNILRFSVTGICLSAFEFRSCASIPFVINRNMSFQAVKDRFLAMNIEEKRRQYKCSKFVKLEEIETWQNSIDSRKAAEETFFKVNSDINSKISIFLGDITSLEIDAIANAANERLAGGGGVDGCIHRAAGSDDLQSECQTLNGCKTGSCKITGAYRLPAKYIIHCVGPIGEKQDLLASCYKSALDLLIENNLRSIAFPCISTGIYGYPNESAAHVALKTVRTWLEVNQANVDRIIFVLFLPKDIEIYKNLLTKYFPTQN